MPAPDTLLTQRLTHCLKDWQKWGLCSQPPSINDCLQISGGYTNTSFLLTTDASRLLIRLEAENSEALDLDRDAEYSIHCMVADAGLSSRVFYRSETKRYWVREYIEGKPLSGVTLSKHQLRKIADVLQKLHSLPVPEGVPVLNIREKANHYWQQLITAPENQSLQRFKTNLQEKLGATPKGALTLCHMDTVPANWIEAEQLYLMDWEYAAAGHPCWDIAAFLQQVNISREDETYFLDSYFQDSPLMNDLPQARLQLDYLSALWFRLQGLVSVEKTEANLQQLLTANYQA